MWRPRRPDSQLCTSPLHNCMSSAAAQGGPARSFLRSIARGRRILAAGVEHVAACTYMYSRRKQGGLGGCKYGCARAPGAALVPQRQSHIPNGPAPQSQACHRSSPFHPQDLKLSRLRHHLKMRQGLKSQMPGQLRTMGPPALLPKRCRRTSVGKGGRAVSYLRASSGVSARLGLDGEEMAGSERAGLCVYAFT